MEEVLEEQAIGDFSLLGEGGFIYQGESDVDGGGTVQVNRFDAAVAGRADIVEGLRWGNLLFFGANDYDLDGGGFGNAWETILALRYSTRLTYDLNEQWGIFAGGLMMFSAETDADWGDSFTGGGTLGAEYRHSETLFVSLGVGLITQLEDDVVVTPAVALNWLPHEQWAVRVGAVPASGGSAAAAEVAYRVVEPVELGLGVVYNQRRFRLNDSSTVASDGVGEDNNLPVRLRVGWTVVPHLSLHFLGGVVLGGELEVDDQNGNRIDKDDYDPAAYVGARLIAWL